MLMDSDIISQTLSWTLVLWLIQLVYVVHRYMEAQLLIWKPHPSNPSDLNANNENRINETNLFSMLFSNNHMKSLLGMVLMDKNGFFQTSFEYMVFTFVYLIHSFSFAADALINDYIKKVIIQLALILYRLLIHKFRFLQLFFSVKTKYSRIEYLQSISISVFSS